MKVFLRLYPRFFAINFIALSLTIAANVCARAQSPQPANDEPSVQTPAQEPSPAPEAAASSIAAEGEAVQRRLTRARSLAAIGKLAAAANELETLRASSKDESVRDVTRVLLMAIFVEMPDYPRATALLEEAYKARTPGETDDAATHSYFALAGQTVNAVRAHLERYRAFGINVSDASDLPTEASGDLESVRALLERVVVHAKALHEEQAKGGEAGRRGLDAAALLEDAATVRMRVARHDVDRTRWQTEVSEARQHLFSSETRIASIAGGARPAPAASSAQPNASSANSQQQKTSSAPTATAQAPAASARPAGSNQTATPAAGGAANNVSDAPVAVGALTSKARQRVPPSYPPIARTARVSGVVTVYLIVDEKGEVESVQRTDGPPQLQQAAIDAARRWKFNQTVIDGKPVRVTGYLSFNFSL